MEELNQIKIDHVDNEQRLVHRGVRAPYEIPELENDSSSDDDSDDDLSEPCEDDDDLVLVRCPVTLPAQVKSAAPAGLRPQPMSQPQASSASGVVSKPTSKSGNKVQPPTQGSTVEKSGRRQRSTDRCPDAGRTVVYRQR